MKTNVTVVLNDLETIEMAGKIETTYSQSPITGILFISSTTPWGAFAGTTSCLETSNDGVMLEDDEEDEDEDEDELLEELLEELDEGGVSARYAHFALA